MVREIKLISAKLEDLEKIYKIFEKSKYILMPPKKEAYNRIRTSLTSKNHQTHIIKENSREVGYVVITIKNKICIINFIALIKSKQKKGIGKITIKKIIRIANRFNCNKIKLAVWIKNFNAIKLYNELEFYVIGLEKKVIKNKEDRLVMEKKVK